MSATSAPQAEFQDAGKPLAQPVYQVDTSGNPINSADGQSVTVVGALPAGTNLIGSVEITDGTNTANVLAATSVSNAANKQAAQLVAGAFAEQASLSAGALNADLVPSTDVSNYREVSLQITGTWSGTFTFQGSNDNANWGSIVSRNIGQANASAWAVSTTANATFIIPIAFRYLRVRMTSYASGTAQGTLELYTQSSAADFIPSVNQNGTWTVQPGNTQNTTPWLFAGPKSNATAAANAGTGKAIKASAGALWSVVVTATGTAATTLYDNASASSGTALLTIPASAAVGTIYSFPGGAPAANGIYADQVANAPGITVYYQ